MKQQDKDEVYLQIYNRMISEGLDPDDARVEAQDELEQLEKLFT